MNEKQAFEVMQIEYLTDNRWKVRGRSYSNLQKGDILYIYTENDKPKLPFEVIEIWAFGKSLEELSYGYASELDILRNPAQQDPSDA